MIQLTITYNSITINCQASGYRLIDGFYPQTAPDDKTNVSERFDLLLSGTNPMALVYALQQAFAWAKAHPSPANGAWLNYAIDESAALQKALIVNGLVLYDARLVNRWKYSLVKVTVMIERKPEWRGALTAISLSNPNGSGVNGVTVQNHWDGGTGHVNYVEIAANGISGDLPTPLKLQVTNNYNNATGTGYIWIGHNVESDPANFPPVLEAESATGGTTTTPAATSSNNAYQTFSITTDGDVLLGTWALSAALLGYTKSKYFKILARFISITSVIKDVWFRPDIYYGTVVPLWEGPLTRPSDTIARAIRDLGIVQLPPWLADVSSPDALSLRLYGRRAIASTINVSMDYLYLLPVESYRELAVNGAVEYESAIVDDGSLAQLYSQNSAGAARRGDVVGHGSPILGVPGRLQRLYFVQHSETADSAAIDRTLSIKAWYEARRLVA